jgi:hypothetical protein
LGTGGLHEQQVVGMLEKEGVLLFRFLVLYRIQLLVLMKHGIGQLVSYLSQRLWVSSKALKYPLEKPH